MTSNAIYETLDSLAERYIPAGRHKLLHINSRELWKSLMLDLIESQSLTPKSTLLVKCAVSWELLLIQKLSIQN